MNYYEIVSNKDQTITVDSETLKDETVSNGFAGDIDTNYKVHTTNEQFDISKLLSVEKSLFKEIEGDLCGIDDTRTRVPDTKIFPYSAICRLYIYNDDDTLAGAGSGWLVGKSTVITAGHNVFDKNLRKWYKEILVVPGKNGSVDSEVPPFGSYLSDKLYSVKGWTEQLNKDFDYGAIILSKKIGETTGYFGFRTDPDSDVSNFPIKICGYPGDKAIDTQWYSTGRILSPIYERKIAYKLYTAEGDSGCPVWKDDSNYHAIGIHVHGGCPHSAIRITKDVYDNIKKWKELGDT